MTGVRLPQPDGFEGFVLRHVLRQPAGFEGPLPAVLLDEPLLARDLAPRRDLHHRSTGCQLGLHAAAAPVADEVASHRDAIAGVDQSVDRPLPAIEGIVDLAVERSDSLASAKAAPTPTVCMPCIRTSV